MSAGIERHGFVLSALVIALAAVPGCDDPGNPAAPDSTVGVAVQGIPTDNAGMNAFLQRREYASWAKESRPHPSTGPHGSTVLTFINPKLDASLKAGATEHPVGAASVKEFFDDAGKVNGWASYVKALSGSDSGNGWYWYETFDATPGAGASEGRGNRVCTGCHSQGRDYVRIPYPLQ
jgi:hypothetical protein